MSSAPSGRPAAWNLPSWARAGLVCAALAVYWTVTFQWDRTWGWDEATHAQLPAVRMLLSLGAGDLSGFSQVLHSCQQYPFGWPLVLGGLQGLLGISELVCRAAGIAAWSCTLWGVFLLAQEVTGTHRSDSEVPRRGDDLLPWLALAFAALSPMTLGYAASLFLEVPFTLCSVFALRAWLRRSTRRELPGAARRELAAGAWLVAAFFVKFNYGLLLLFGCALDYLVGVLVARRAGRFWNELYRLPFLALPVLLALFWWLVLPLPFGLAVGEEHRRVMLEFLGGNQQMAATPWEQRLIFWAVYLSFTARLFALQVLGCLAAPLALARPGVRLLVLVFLGMGIPVWTHNFQLDRFLIPNAPAFWILAAVGLSAWIPSGAIRRTAVLVPLALAVLLFPSLDGPWLAERLGLMRGDEATREYIAEILSKKHRLGADREMWVPGIPPETAGSIFDLVTTEVGPEDSVGWIGVSTELCPAAVHLALLERFGNQERFLRDANRPMDVTFTGLDPNWSADQLEEFVDRFDVVISTDPPDYKDRTGRAFSRHYSSMLVNELGWTVRQLGSVTIPVEGDDGRPFSIYALRPPAAEAGT